MKKGLYILLMTLVGLHVPSTASQKSSRAKAVFARLCPPQAQQASWAPPRPPPQMKRGPERFSFKKKDLPEREEADAFIESWHSTASRGDYLNYSDTARKLGLKVPSKEDAPKLQLPPRGQGWWKGNDEEPL